MKFIDINFDYNITPDGKTLFINGKEQPIYKQKRGYVLTYVNRKGIYVHRLVAMKYIPNPLNKSFINHKNGNTYDNNVENLEWVTGSENQKHAIEIGLKKNPGGKLKKLTLNQANTIRNLYETDNYSQRELSKRFNVSQYAISQIILNKQYIIQ
jgi:hypothetical protein